MSWSIRLLAVTALALVVSTGRSDDDTKPFDDADFVKAMANCNLTEVDLGKIANERGRNEDVKKYGKKMTEDHQKALDDLKTAAKSAGVTVPEKIDDAEHQKVLDKFKDYKGENFDRDYIKQMVEGHEKAVKKITRATKEAKNQQIKDYATKVLPVVQGHLDEAKKLQDQIK
jgi:putative membrane protein